MRMGEWMVKKRVAGYCSSWGPSAPEVDNQFDSQRDGLTATMRTRADCKPTIYNDFDTGGRPSLYLSRR
jgi:hypothetical protein